MTAAVVTGGSTGIGPAIVRAQLDQGIGGQLAGGLFAYGAARAAVINWTKSMALHLAGRGIRVSTVAVLCSDRARQITGQVIVIDGGMTLGRPVGQ